MLELKVMDLCKACAVLHNRILEHTTRVKQATGEWASEDILVEEIPKIIYKRSFKDLPNDYVFNLPEPKDAYQVRLFKLVEHFYVRLKAGKILWPSRKSTVKYQGVGDHEVEDFLEWIE